MCDTVCKVCGRPCPRDAIICTEPTVYVLCKHCYSFVGTCAFCSESKKLCAFETDSSPIPKQVQQTIRQGNMVMQTVVNNPERVRVTCQNGCKCWNEEFGCLRQNNYCPNYNEEVLNENH